MKFSASLSLFVIAVAVSSMQSASAQETRGARFNYAPNIWKTEASRVPKGYNEFNEPPHSVRSGSVPTSSSLGIDPSMLEKPAPPPQVAARPATTSATPSMFVPKTNAAFSPAFGKPQGIIPAVAQSLPAVMPTPAHVKPQMARPATGSPASGPVAHHRPSGARTAVAAHLRRPTLHNVIPASATPAVASYDKNFGYVPGPYLPSSTGGGAASTEVKGTLMTPTRHHKK